MVTDDPTIAGSRYIVREVKNNCPTIHEFESDLWQSELLGSPGIISMWPSDYVAVVFSKQPGVYKLLPLSYPQLRAPMNYLTRHHFKA